MKLCLCVILSFASTFALGKDLQFFMAENTHAKILDNSNLHRTRVEIEFDRPCWARFVRTVEFSELQQPLHVEGSFTSVVGVILQEVDGAHGCEEVFKDHQVQNVDTTAAEGSFLGFKAISANKPN